MKPHELASAYFLEQKGYPSFRAHRQCQLADKSWLLWYDMPDGELLLHASYDWDKQDWAIFTVYFEPG